MVDVSQGCGTVDLMKYWWPAFPLPVCSVPLLASFLQFVDVCLHYLCHKGLCFFHHQQIVSYRTARPKGYLQRLGKGLVQEHSCSTLLQTLWLQELFPLAVTLCSAPQEALHPFWYLPVIFSWHDFP